MNPNVPGAIEAIIRQVTETFSSKNPYPAEDLPPPTPEFERWFDEGVRIIEEEEDPALGIEAFSKALEIDAESYPALDNRARLFTDLGDHEHAAADLIEVLQRAPHCVESFLRLGEAMAGLEENTLAAKIFAATILLRVKTSEGERELTGVRPHLGLARLRLASKETDVALRLVNAALKLEPKSIEAYQLQAEVHSLDGDPGEALICLNKALEVAEEPVAELLAERAKAHRLNGDEALAGSDFADALRSVEDDAMAAYGLAISMMNAGQDDWALEAVNQAIASEPAFAEAYKIRSFLRPAADAEAALQDLDEALNLQPEMEDAWAMRGDLLWELGRIDEAIAAYQRALEIDPEYPDALVGIGFARLGRKAYREALTQFQMVLNSDEARLDALLGRGLIFLDLGDAARALEDADKILRISSRDLFGCLLRGEALLELGEYEEAISSLQEMLDDCRAGGQSGADTVLARAYLRLGNPDRARQILAEAGEVFDDDDDIWFAQAELSLAEGDAIAAREAIEAAISQSPDDSRYHELEGDIGKADGDLTRARDSYARALEHTAGRLVQERLRRKLEGCG